MAAHRKDRRNTAGPVVLLGRAGSELEGRSRGRVLSRLCRAVVLVLQMGLAVLEALAAAADGAAATTTGGHRPLSDWTLPGTRPTTSNTSLSGRELG